MIELNKKTKKAKNWVECYKRCSSFSLYDVYKTPSYRKVCIFNKCKKFMAENNGTYLKVLGGNSSFFTIGFTVKLREYVESIDAYITRTDLIIMTAYNNYIICDID